MCQQVSNGSVAILYFTNTEQFGRQTAASQYFLQMAGFLGIPVIAWNADNAGLESVRYVYLMIFANIPCSNLPPSLYLINKQYMYKSWDERQLFEFVFDHYVTLQLFVFSRFPSNGEIYSLACQGCKNTFFSFVRDKMNLMSRGMVH